MMELWPEMAGTELFDAYVQAVETGEAFIGSEVAHATVIDGEERVGLLRHPGPALRRRAADLLRDITHEREASRRLRETTIELAVEHRIVERLQQALLPRTLPESDQFQIAACYNPVDERADLGGDWYDAFRLPDGRIGLSIGDVTGHGLDAAALMAQCRLALRAYAYDASDTPGPSDPARVLQPARPLAGRVAHHRAGHRHLRHLRPRHRAPALVTGGPPAARWCAGRSGPGRHDGCTRWRPTAVRRWAPGWWTRYPICEMDLPADSFVLFYTDGLVERRGELIDDGIDEVKARLIADDWDALATLCDALTDSVRAGLVREDDVCILALRRTRPRRAGPLSGRPLVPTADAPTAAATRLRCAEQDRSDGADRVGLRVQGSSRGSAEVRLSNARATGRQPDPARRSRRSPELAEPLDFDVAVAAEVESLPELRRSLAAWLAPQGLSERRSRIGPGGDERAGGQRHRGLGSR